MKGIITLFLLIILTLNLYAQHLPKEQIQIMTLGVFHFNYPGLDAYKTEDKDKIDVLSDANQVEIQKLVDDLAEFNPTHILVERQPSYQKGIDSLYNEYINDNLVLKRGEIYQIGFRLAKKLDHKKLWCVDDMGTFYPHILEIFNDSIKLSAFEGFYETNPDSLINNFYTNLYKKQDIIFKEEGLNACIQYLNNPELILLKQGAYLTGVFKYSTDENKYAGADFETCRWYNRNLHIFRNVQDITNNPEHRILLIIGAGHLGVLNPLFEASPEYEFVSPINYIK
ncbi:MAG: hypothetical protein A2W99_14450 [Bacteroidetes bacterium GWF2_33_16]|nr:MAG: hypothetical protein A2X00_08660 [Bacteroidetes bacterium GWE2_32_14]OFY04875.1 MAG: hypothetical protein A2W99_14450 [Bacteroidetes bacterium GWF2_33_16]